LALADAGTLATIAAVALVIDATLPQRRGFTGVDPVIP
jgi:hypothetical protein